MTCVTVNVADVKVSESADIDVVKCFFMSLTKLTGNQYCVNLCYKIIR